MVGPCIYQEQIRALFLRALVQWEGKKCLRADRPGRNNSLTLSAIHLVGYPPVASEQGILPIIFPFPHKHNIDH